MRRAAAAVALAASLSSGCGSAATPEQVLADRVDAATVAANERDADGLRDAALDLADAISAQRDAQELPAARAEQLLSLATTLREQADVIDPDVQARLQAEQDAAKAREEAAAERAAREQAEREATEAAQQRERAAAERAAREQAERAAAERAAGEQAEREATEAEQQREREATEAAERAAAEESARAEQDEDADKVKVKGKGADSDDGED